MHDESRKRESLRKSDFMRSNRRDCGFFRLPAHFACKDYTVLSQIFSWRIAPGTLLLALLCTLLFAIIFAIPQISGLAAISVDTLVTPPVRLACQFGLIVPLLLGASLQPYFSGRAWLSRLFLFLLVACIIVYANFPSPFFDYVWDVFLVESIFAFLLSSVFLGKESWGRYYPWPMRILLFRLIFCMGIIKFVHGMPEWRSGLALKFFWANQPMPGFLSWYAAQLPDWMHRVMSAYVFIVEIPGPFLIFLGHRARILYFFLNLILQLGIFVSGNYAFFNLLTILVGLSLFEPKLPPAQMPRELSPLFRRWRQALLSFGLCILAGWVFNGTWLLYRTLWLQPGYLPETSWILRHNSEQLDVPAPVRYALTPYAIAKVANPYALFGNISRYRLEIAIEGSAEKKIWRQYRFRVRPDALNWPPVWYAPHHWRLDHQMYYESFRLRDPALAARMSHFLGARWMPNLIRELSAQNRAVSGLLAHDPFADKKAQFFRFVYRYYIFTSAEEMRRTGNYWKTDTPHPGQFFDGIFPASEADRLP